ncbi:hypothetical protein HK103_007348 [Boothiomyces macroporosus]|uniref:t-SNARE coiled-coil homology domain-containing protein n=1 Tax=Boothiomyces macroporosus TaxID=261099 RepID=A0AAD5UKR7_9FUNG|nr:hypothetical protein HK103_007348 [Boothiomyces macroporosus]
MATRSRTLLFLNFRNSFGRTGPQKYVDASENAGLMSNAAGERNALPGFNDNAGENKTIDDATEELTKMFQHCQKLIKDVNKGNSQQSEKISVKILEEYFLSNKGLRKQENQGASSNFAVEEDEDDLDAMAVVNSNEQAITQREKEINEIAKSIMTLADIFKELQTMVIDQGTVLDRIDYNIEQTNVSLEAAHGELLKVFPINVGGCFTEYHCSKVLHCSANCPGIEFVSGEFFSFSPFIAMFRPTLLRRIPVIPRFRQNHTTAHSLTALETRWSKLPEAEKGAIADSLAEVQKGDWKKMTLEQKRAAYYIAYGSFGNRAPHDPTLPKRVAAWLAFFLGVGTFLWFQSSRLLPNLRTQTPEWKAATEALSIEQKQNPFSGPYAKELKN